MSRLTRLLRALLSRRAKSDEIAEQYPPRRSAIPDQTFTDTPLRFADRHGGDEQLPPEFKSALHIGGDNR